MSKKHIDECLRENLEAYFRDRRGTEPGGLYDMMLRAMEKPSDHAPVWLELS